MIILILILVFSGFPAKRKPYSDPVPCPKNFHRCSGEINDGYYRQSGL